MLNQRCRRATGGEGRGADQVVFRHHKFRRTGGGTPVYKITGGVRLGAETDRFTGEILTIAAHHTRTIARRSQGDQPDHRRPESRGAR
ncbi:MAG: hypothetical protein KDJ28_11730 [Candidatus Competibacteraceae bacterium]|nr:hypothetical protein [Candidatus Competibacteraceae bacterium]